MCDQTPRATLELPPTLSAPHLAREFIGTSLCVVHAMPVLEVALLLTSEAITNAVVHGAPPVILAVDCVETGTEVRVRDGSPEPPELQNPDQSESGGRGVILIDLLSEAWGVEPHPSGKVVWFLLTP